MQNIINHVVLVLDRSLSMRDKAESVIKVTDNLVKHLATTSTDMDQETRLTVYLFNDFSECVIYDKDVLRMPSIRGLYRPDGNTNLVGTTLQALAETLQIPQRYGDHSFLFYVITDGENNREGWRASELLTKLTNLPENVTVATLVPNNAARAYAQQFGFPHANIELWNAASSTFDEVGDRIQKTTRAFMVARSKGIRGTKNLFELDTSNLTAAKVKRTLDELDPTAYQIFNVGKDSTIRDFVERKTRRKFVKGSAYYQLTKSETVQPYKQICLQEHLTGRVYAGNKARAMLKLPNHEVKVSAVDHLQFLIFVQSTSVNRKLIGGTQLLVLR